MLNDPSLLMDNGLPLAKTASNNFALAVLAATALGAAAAPEKLAITVASATLAISPNATPPALIPTQPLSI